MTEMNPHLLGTLIGMVLFIAAPVLVYVCTKMAVYGFLRARKDFHEREGRERE